MPSNNTSLPVFFYTYVLQSREDREHYIGYSENLRRRLEEHRRSKSFAQYRLPVDLIYYEACVHQADAKQREKYLKSTAGRRFLAKRLKHFNANAVWHRVKRSPVVMPQAYTTG